MVYHENEKEKKKSLCNGRKDITEKFSQNKSDSS